MSSDNEVMKRIMAEYYRTSMHDLGAFNAFEAFVSAREKRDAAYKLCYLLGRLDYRFSKIDLVRESFIVRELLYGTQK